jgi:hypothetical protein
MSERELNEEWTVKLVKDGFDDVMNFEILSPIGRVAFVDAYGLRHADESTTWPHPDTVQIAARIGAVPDMLRALHCADDTAIFHGMILGSDRRAILERWIPFINEYLPRKDGLEHGPDCKVTADAMRKLPAILRRAAFRKASPLDDPEDYL